jgi:hypothetical protein
MKLTLYYAPIACSHAPKGLCRNTDGRNTGC